jgi:hypothetical protein
LSDNFRSSISAFRFPLSAFATVRSKKISGHVPWPIYELIERRAKAERYRNVWRYVIGCVIRDIFAPQHHIFNHVIADADPSEQDALLQAFHGRSPEHLRATVRNCLSEKLTAEG